MSWITVAGWIGTACFFSRFLVQWIQSERARQSLAPVSFWILSVAGAVLLGFYSAVKEEPILLAGHMVNGSIFLRNLWLSRRKEDRLALHPAILTAIALLALVPLVATQVVKPRPELAASIGWLACVTVGQTIWSSRFIIQWWLSERRGYSHFPPSFWWLSLAGNALLLTYTVHVGDPIFIASYLLGPIVQIRNLLLPQQEAPRRPGSERDVELTPALGAQAGGERRPNALLPGTSGRVLDDPRGDLLQR